LAEVFLMETLAGGCAVVAGHDDRLALIEFRETGFGGGQARVARDAHGPVFGLDEIRHRTAQWLRLDDVGRRCSGFRPAPSGVGQRHEEHLVLDAG
jgi:hypothetical protein